jgi:hypothetical protein
MNARRQRVDVDQPTEGQPAGYVAGVRLASGRFHAQQVPVQQLVERGEALGGEPARRWLALRMLPGHYFGVTSTTKCLSVVDHRDSLLTPYWAA